jgi:aspartate racemase
MTRMIGILAGMGPRSTAPFVDLVVTEFQRQCGARHDMDFPPMMVLSWPTPFYVDRSVDHDAMLESLTCGLRKLERAGADYIALPSNVAHLWYDAIKDCISVPLIDMIGETITATPMEARRIALIATRPTVSANLYQERLYARCTDRRTCVMETDPWQMEVDDLIRTVKTTRRRSIAEARWRDLLECIYLEGADAVILACTDISAIADLSDTPIPVIDAAQSLAAAVVRWYRLHE